jgi:cytochrome b involved in lipid metabolism
MRSFTRDQVAQHNSATSAWIIIDTVVYDVTKFASSHPGGELLLLDFAGKDVSTEFYEFHRQEVLLKYDRLRIGTIVNEKPVIEIKTPTTISRVPYAEPSHLQGYFSPYYKYHYPDIANHMFSCVKSVGNSYVRIFSTTT